MKPHVWGRPARRRCARPAARHNARERAGLCGHRADFAQIAAAVEAFALYQRTGGSGLLPRWAPHLEGPLDAEEVFAFFQCVQDFHRSVHSDGWPRIDIDRG